MGGEPNATELHQPINTDPQLIHGCGVRLRIIDHPGLFKAGTNALLIHGLVEFCYVYRPYPGLG
jgi:hypothetical protein